MDAGGRATNLVYLAKSREDVPTQRLMAAAGDAWHDAAYAYAAHSRAEEAKEAKAKEEEEAAG